jgi:hypothetical protein
VALSNTLKYLLAALGVTTLVVIVGFDDELMEGLDLLGTVIRKMIGFISQVGPTAE